MNTHKNQDKGFTLVELLIVIVILGILATVTVFAVRGITTQGKTTACAADKKTIEVAAESYMAQNGSYPASLAIMVTAGLLKDVSSVNWTYAAPTGVAGASPDYTLTGIGNCVGM
jgi:prepilin-type N-terminal cleavage/methylation domain-containing protein